MGKCDKNKKDCGCCPDFCSKGKKYHDIYCCSGDKCGAGKCGDCKCALISLDVTANPPVVSEIGETIEFTYGITNAGSVDLCGFVQICSTKNGSIELVKKRDTFIPKGSRLVVKRLYTTVAADFNCKTIVDKAAAYVQVEDINWVYSEKICTPVLCGGADVWGSMTQVANATTATTIDVTLDIGNFIDSFADAKNVNLVMKIPPPLTAANITIPAGSGLALSDDGTSIVLTTIPVLAKGETRVYTFSYDASAIVPPAAVAWSGMVTSTTYDPRLENNLIRSVYQFPVIPPP